MIIAILILALFTLFSMIALSSNLREKNYWMLLISVPMLLGGLAGIAYVSLPAFIAVLSLFAGVVKAINHVIAVDDIFYSSRIKYWNPAYWLKGTSYINKYKPGTKKPKFFGSTTFLVWVTDGWHLTNMLYAWLLIIPSFLASNIYELSLVTILSISAGHYTYEYLTQKNEA